MASVVVLVVFFGFQNCAKQGEEEAASTASDLIDQDPSRFSEPEIEILSTVPNVLKTDSLIVSFTVNFFGYGKLQSATCKLNGVDLRNCTDGMVTIENLRDSAYQLVISAQGSNNRKPKDKIIAFQVDKTPPVVRLSTTPSNPSNQRNFNFTFSATDSTSTVASVECSLDGGPFISCTSMSSFNAANLSNGERSIAVRATDAHRNTSQPVNFRWKVDLDAPTLSISSSPPIKTKIKNADFVFSATDNSSGLRTKCRIEPEAFADCSGRFSKVNLAEGNRIFWLEATDLAGNVSTLKYEWTIDSLGPAKPRIATNVSAFTQSKNISYIFSSEDAESGVSYVCAFNSTSFSACTSPLEKVNLSDGNYDLKVQALDALGNPSEVESSIVFVDSVKPDVALNLVSNTATAVDFLISVNKGSGSNIATSKCQLNSGDWFDCSTQLKLTTLSEAPYVLNLKATDLAGNEGQTSANFIFDKTAPVLVFSKTPPSSTQLSDFLFEFSVAESLSGLEKVECALNSVSYGPCTSNGSFNTQNLSQGNHVVRLRARDKNGNQSTVVEYSWKIDKSAPVFQLQTTLATVTSQDSANFTIQTSETDLKYKCKLGASAALEACLFPKAFSSLQTGSYAFVVEAEDSAGNKATQTFNWRVDRVAPGKPTLSSTKPAITKDKNLEFNFTSVENEGAVSFRCGLNTSTLTPCVSPFRSTVTVDGSYVLTVQAFDDANNSSQISTASSLIDTQAPLVAAQLTRIDETGLTFSISAEKGSGSELRTVECKLNSTNWTNCSSAITYSSLSGRDHSFSVRATDLADNVAEVTILVEYGRNLVAVGRSHTCAVRFGKLYCWGDNKRGQLGDGTLISKSKPVLVIDGGVTAVAAGDTNTCAIVSGALKCWGFGIVDRTVSSTHVIVHPTGVRQVDSGFNHTCFVAGSDLFCFGENQWGQLGQGRTDSNFTAAPQRVLSGTIDSLTVSAGFACAVVSKQTQCWGLNDQGQLANGNTTNQSTPVSISSLNETKSVQSGLQHACAVSMSGTLRCWGANYDGQIGNEQRSNLPVTNPFLVQISNVQSIALGFAHSCALVESKLSCWGNNSLGQFGSGLTTSFLKPTQIGTLTWSGLSSRWNTNCGVSDGLTVSCWGQNNLGQVGNNLVGTKYSPVKISSAPADSLAAGDSHSCMTVSGNLSCWGANFAGQLGTGTLDSTKSVTAAASAFAGAQKVIVGPSNSCIISSGALKCWGLNQSGQLGTTSEFLQIFVAMSSGVTAAAVGGSHICAIRNSSELWCIGNNNFGQLGIGTAGNRNVMTRVIASGVTDVAAGLNHTCAVVSGALKCFGANNSGQLGLADANARSTPTTSLNLDANVLSVSTSKFATCAVVANAAFASGKAGVCWGSYKGNQPTLGQKTAEFEGDLKSIAMGDAHVCAHVGGDVECLGDGSSGQIGGGTSAFTDPARIVLSSGVTGLEAGAMHTCATNSSGVYCWGANSTGEVGDGQAWVESPALLSFN